jgi:hypothetical protein
LSGWVRVSCRASKGGSSAAENKEKGVPCLPNRGGDCAGLKVFDGYFLMEKVAREGSMVPDRS